MADQPAENYEALIDGYLDGTLTEDEQARLFARLESDRELLKRFAQITELDAICCEHTGQQIEAELVESQMLPFEADFDDESELPLIHLDAEALTKQKYAAALSYVLRHTFTPKRIAMLATAAAVLLGAVLTLVLLTGPDDTDSIAVAPDMPAASAEPTPRGFDPQQTAIVATLTAEHDAVWDRRPGQDLYAGQGFTLTEGFAEITTNRGAVAILEAPATIELLDNDNAIRLHAGKIVGICETDSSKGFLVRTPHMDVTDLGTRFGVDASPTATGTYVFEGEIEISFPSVPGIARTLKRAQSITLNAAGQETPNPKDIATVFEALVRLNSGVVDASESTQLINSNSITLNDSEYASDTHVSVFQELRSERLPGDVSVCFVSPGRHDRMLPKNTEQGTIPAGTIVRSYVIRARPVGTNSIYEGSLTFDGPILGVMAQPDDWLAFAETMPGRVIELEPSPDELLEGLDSETLFGKERADWLQISQDRRTLDFYLFALANKADHIRVFVAARGDGTVAP